MTIGLARLKRCLTITILMEYAFMVVYQLGYDSTDSNINFNMIIAIAIIGMYAKCDFFRYARELLIKLPQRNLVAFHSMIGANNQYGRVEEALCLFFAMLIAGIFVWVMLFFLVWCGYCYWDLSGRNLGLRSSAIPKG